ncbi:MAG: PorV/PorQ family protein [Elusimicrobia bacterium]|nr:PorV/PorQ family protein [Elusimicrobiota bacterium]
MRYEMIKNNLCTGVSLIVTLCIVCSVLHAAGGSAGYILTRSPSARSSALGDAFGSVDCDIIGVKYNPGLIATISKRQLSLMFNRGLINDTFASVIYGMPTKYGALAYSFDYYDSGILEFYDSYWNKRTVTGEKDMAFAISWGKMMTIGDEFVYPGLTLKYFSSTLVEYKTAAAFALDIGSFYYLSNAPVMVGFSLQNIGTKLKYIEAGDPLPLSLRISGCYKLKNVLVVNDMNYLLNDKLIVPSVGMEFAVSDVFTLRTGYKFNSDVEGLTAGFGLKWKRYEINYSFGSNRLLYNNHVVSINIFYPEKKNIN